MIDTPTLAGLLDPVVAVDSRLGNVAASAGYLRQIVDCAGHGNWYVIGALLEAREVHWTSLTRRFAYTP